MTSVLHILDHSLPQQSGYSFRGHSILRHLASNGIQIAAITGPKQGFVEQVLDEIDGVQYRRSRFDEHMAVTGVRGQLNTIFTLRRMISELLKSGDYQILHAHSPCLNGLAALGHGLPLVYEMRSSWEDAAVSVGTTHEGSTRYRVSRAMETFVARRAAKVVVICDGLRDELVERGIDAEKIVVVPNALPEEMFQIPAGEQVENIRRRYCLDGKRIIGFFGSFFEWEGVDSLIEAMPGVISAVPGAHLLLAGGGRQETELKALVKALRLERNVTFAGRIEHDEVRAFYAAAHVMAYPRLPDRLTNMVTPLKPLEAMAQKALVVASDVGGHRELIVPEKTGRLFDAGNRQALIDELVAGLSPTEENFEMVHAGHDFVQAERRWAHISKRYLPVYSGIIRGASVSAKA